VEQKKQHTASKLAPTGSVRSATRAWASGHGASLRRVLAIWIGATSTTVSCPPSPSRRASRGEKSPYTAAACSTRWPGANSPTAASISRLALPHRIADTTTGRSSHGMVRWSR
jgi:hypothetical protein